LLAVHDEVRVLRKAVVDKFKFSKIRVMVRIWRTIPGARPGVRHLVSGAAPVRLRSRGGGLRGAA
jgi:hypothetical protein